MSNRDMERDEREVKLPVWAQDIINGLRRRVLDRQQTIRELMWENPDSDTFVETYGSEENKPLPRGTVIRFELGPESWNAIDVRVARDRGRNDQPPYLSIMGMGMISVEPSSGNVIHVRTLR